MLRKRCLIQTLPTRDPFGIARGTRRCVENLFINADIAWGEGAPVYYHGQNAETMRQFALEWLDTIEALPNAIHDILDHLPARFPSQSGLCMAIDLLLHDAWGRRQSAPLFALWGQRWDSVPPSSFTIGLDTMETVLEKIDRAADFPILKIKLGGENDREFLQAVAERSKKPLYVDANEAWSAEQTLNLLPLLEECGVELLEQPLPRDDKEGYAQLLRDNPANIPIFIDESIQGLETVEPWSGLADGINIKLAKCGGLHQARKMIELARNLGLKVMVGCMIESSLGISAAAQLAPQVDYLDLDGAALLADDPFDGVRLIDGRLTEPKYPGLSALPNLDWLESLQP